MYTYKVTQATTSKTWFGTVKERNIIYSFNNYNEALIFALNEQIRYFKCEIDSKHTNTRDSFAKYHSLNNWVKLAHKNPLHYIGLRSAERVNLEQLYFYYLNSGNIHKLKKH